MPPASSAVVWPRWARVVASAAIAWHLVGVMVAPLATPPRFEGGDSVLGAELKRVYDPYITALFLNHAYKFFAPNPGNSHLLRYDLYFADGTRRVNRDDQLLPDRFHHWPRLLYHRHFMLTEFIDDFAPPWVWEGRPAPQSEGPAPLPAAELGERVPPTAPPTAQGEMLPPPGEEQGGPPPHVRVYLDGIAKHLAQRTGATRVDLFYRRHLLPTVEDYRRVGRKLDAPESYQERLVYSYTTEKKS